MLRTLRTYIWRHKWRHQSMLFIGYFMFLKVWEKNCWRLRLSFSCTHPICSVGLSASAQQIWAVLPEICSSQCSWQICYSDPKVKNNKQQFILNWIRSYPFSVSNPGFSTEWRKRRSICIELIEPVGYWMANSYNQRSWMEKQIGGEFEPLMVALPFCKKVWCMMLIILRTCVCIRGLHSISDNQCVQTT